MKAKLFILAVALIATIKINCQVPDNGAISILLNAYSEKSYSKVPVSDQNLELILKSGIKAPSALNNQPWRFTVVKDEITMRQIVNDIVPGNVLIIVSGFVSKTGTTPDFDCGLATENMFIAAHCLGLGARIYGSPVDKLNARKAEVQIPEGYKVVMVLRVGNVTKQTDAVSAASPRKEITEIVNYKK
jgi:nitroreductase